MEQTKTDTVEIVRYPDPRLYEKNADLNETTDEVREKVRLMFEAMYATKGMGLAAPQIGWNVRLFVMNSDGAPENEVVCINPEIIEEEGEACHEEGCLSLPDARANVIRPENIKVEFTDLEGKRHKRDFTGLVARCFCHEDDHLHGILFHTRLSPVEKTKVSSRLKELRREYKSKRKSEKGKK